METPFPSAERQIEINSFSYTAQRMGGCPTITATAMFERCLDDDWNGVYAKFNGEKFYVKTTPDSGKVNTDVRYEHSLTLYSERFLLDNIYFLDAVQGDETVDRYKSNSTKIFFMGNIKEFVDRLADSLSYSNSGYTAVLDDGITSEDKLVDFEEKYISEALQEAFNIFEVPYYFEGKTIHFGYTSNAISTPVEYGSTKALMTVHKKNSNYRIVNRCSGYGSEENIPFYYPNRTPKGEMSVGVGRTNSVLKKSDITITNIERFCAEVGDDQSIAYKAPVINTGVSRILLRGRGDQQWYNFYLNGTFGYKARDIDPSPTANTLWLTVEATVVTQDDATYEFGVKLKCGNREYDRMTFKKFMIDGSDTSSTQPFQSNSVGEIYLTRGTHTLYCSVIVDITGTSAWNDEGTKFYPDFHVAGKPRYVLNGREVKLEDLGVSLAVTPADGDTFFPEVVEGSYIQPTQHLMPPIYRLSGGAERFYNAVNNAYPSATGSGYAEFEHPYSAGDAREAIVKFDDIKPSIVGMTNSKGQRMDRFLAFAWDANDSDEFDETTGEYYHPYFYAKLPKFDGAYGFNLFDCASDSAMTISMTSGTCGGCTFEIGVGEKSNRNIVQVDALGSLVRDEKGNVKLGPAMPEQNDTFNNEVWIALKKDNTTYPKVMPSFTRHLVPKPEDNFVILNIQLPYAYILAAEERLKKEIIRYMEMNNSEKFNFSIGFSRIFFTENPSYLEQLNENARILVKYNNQSYTFYISTFKYNMTAGDVLPEITVDLVEELTAGSNSLQQKLDALKQSILSGVGGGDILKQGMKYYIRKDVEDTAQEKIGFNKGVTFGDYREGRLGGGGKVSVDEQGNTHAEFDFLKIRRKAEFTELTIEELKSVGGSILLSLASMECVAVERYNSFFRCYFDDAEAGNTGLENQFVYGDLARCQSFNTVESRYYWRKVVGTGANYIDLSDISGEYDTDSDAPQAGDKIVQLGNVNNPERQSAQELSCYGENSPSFIMYNGIDSFSLVDKDIHGVVFNNVEKRPLLYNYGAMYFGDREHENDYISYNPTTHKFIIKAQVEFTAGSTGLNNMPEWQNALQKIQDQIDGVINTWFSTDIEPEQKGAPAPNADDKSVNYPVRTWTDYASHLGDLYYSDEGKAYRFQKVLEDMLWIEIEDTELTRILQEVKEALKAANEAAELAAAAQSVANAANRKILGWMSDGVISPLEYGGVIDEDTFIASDYADLLDRTAKYEVDATTLTQRYQAYKTDLENIINSDGDENGNRSIPAEFRDHQELYYDERTTILRLIAAAAKKEAEEAKEAAIKAKEDAEKALKDAEKALEEAAAANKKLTEWAKDGVISPVEYTGIVEENVFVEADYAETVAIASKYDFDAAVGDDDSDALKAYKRDYLNFLDTYRDYHAKLAAIIDGEEDENGNITIPENFLASMTSFYAARTALKKDIAEEAQNRHNTLSSKVLSWTADDVISPMEYYQIRDEMVRIMSDYIYLQGYAIQYDVDYDALESAYLFYHKDLNDIVNGPMDDDGNIPIPENFLAHETAYYTERQKVLEEINKVINNKFVSMDEKLDLWLDDGVFDEKELGFLKQELESVTSDSEDVIDSASKYADVDSAKFETAANNYKQMLQAILDDENHEVPTTLAKTQQTYYTERTAILAAISAAADAYKKHIDDLIDKLNSSAVANIEVEYAVGSSKDTAPTEGWGTGMPTVGASQYLWQRLKTIYADEAKKEPTYSTPTIIPSLEGGVGVKSLTQLYYMTKDGTIPSAPTSPIFYTQDIAERWTTTRPTWEEGYIYYFCTQIQYDDSDNHYDWTAVTSDNSSRVRAFYCVEGGHPDPPYNVGDVWYCATGTWSTSSSRVGSADGVVTDGGVATRDASTITYVNEILTCVNSKAAGESFDINDWTRAGGYSNASDYMYLVDALPPASKTDAYGGLLLSNILGVKDESDSVVAMMNGLKAPAFVDEEHGVLMIAAGITGGVSHASSAATQIWSDGTLLSTKGIFEEIQVLSGNIGQWSLQNGMLHSEQAILGGSSDAWLSGDEISVYGSGSGYMEGSPAGSFSSIVSINTHSFGAMVTPLKVSAHGSGVYICGISVSVDDGDTAISCSGGVFEGLRPNTIIARGSVSLSEFDYNVVVAATGSCSIALPNNPQIGQTYRIFKPAYRRTTIVSISYGGKSVDIMDCTNGREAQLSVLDDEHFGVVELLYDGSGWNVMTCSRLIEYGNTSD